MDSDQKQNTSTSPNSELLDAALSYRRQGYCPIPVGKDKKPLIKWQEFQSKLPSEEQITAWWHQHSTANIAVLCGHNGLTVLDIDVKHRKENKEIANRIASSITNHAPVIKTPSGGIHIHFKDTERLSKTVRIKDLGDFQAKGTYVLVPPSKGYEFLNDIRKPFEIENSWEYVTDYLVQFGIDLNEQQVQSSTRLNLSEKIKEQSRNNTLTKMAGWLRYSGAPPKLMQTVLGVVNQEHFDPPVSDQEVESVVKSISRYPAGQQNFTSNLNKQPLEEVPALKTISAGELQKKAIEYLKPIECFPLLGQSNFIPEGWCILLAGAPKAGKTELITAALQDWEKTILYLTEEPQMLWARRLAEKEINWKDINLELGFYVGAGSHTIATYITQTPAQIVIIDTVRNVIGGYDENDNSQVAAAINPVIKAARENNKTLILLHHMRKGGGDNGEGISGGHALFGAVDVGLEITRNGTAKNQRIVKGWGRILEIPELLYERTEEGDLVALGSPGEVGINSVKKRALETLFSDVWQTTTEILKRLGDPKPSDEQLRAALKDLAFAGEILRDPDISAGAKQGARYTWKLPDDPTSNNEDLRLEEKNIPENVFNADNIDLPELAEPEETQAPLIGEEKDE